MCKFCDWFFLSFFTSSSYGQNLETSMFVGETLFSIITIMVGLVLFAHLIGNIQVLLFKYIPSFIVCIKDHIVRLLQMHMR